MMQTTVESFVPLRPLKSKAASSDRFLYIDALRGIAAVVVMYFHFANGMLEMPGVYHGIDHDIAAALCQFVEMGKFGVALFFIISGFVIPSSFGLIPQHRIKRFVISRFFRLYPMYWISLAAFVMISAGHHLFFSDGIILANITMLQGFAHIQDVNPVFWTLQIELIFYALCVILSMRGQLDNIRVLSVSAIFFVMCALLLSVIRYILVIKLPVAVPLALFLMFTGAIFRQTLVGQDKRALKHLVVLLLFFFFALPGICILAYNHDYGFHEAWYQYWTSYTLAIAVFIFGTTSLKMTGRVMVFLGTISYSVYLLHPIVWDAFSVIGITPQILHPDLIILLIGSATLLISYATYSLIERPAVALGKRIITRQGLR